MWGQTSIVRESQRLIVTPSTVPSAHYAGVLARLDMVKRRVSLMTEGMSSSYAFNRMDVSHFWSCSVERVLVWSATKGLFYFMTRPFHSGFDQGTSLLALCKMLDHFGNFVCAPVFGSNNPSRLWSGAMTTSPTSRY